MLINYFFQTAHIIALAFLGLLVSYGEAQGKTLYLIVNALRSDVLPIKEIRVEKTNQIAKEIATTHQAPFKIVGNGSSPFDSKKRAVDQINQAVKELNPQPGDSLLVFVMGDGGVERNIVARDQILLTLGNENVSWEKVVSAITSASPVGVHYKIATNSCYGGVIHEISRKVEGLCAVSTVPKGSPSSSYYPKEPKDPFEIGFWRGVGIKAASFASAGLSGLDNNHGNPGLGSLSSFDYVDFVLKEGPYKKNVGDFKYMGNFPKGDVKQERPNYVFMQAPPGYKPTLNLSSGGIQKPSPRPEPCLIPGLLQEMQSQLLVSKKMLNHLMVDAMGEKMRKMPASAPMPPLYLTLFTSAFDKLRTKRGLYDRVLTKRNAKEKLSPEDLKLMDELKFVLKVAEAAKHLSRFDKEATPEQKKKFMDLLQCEWEPL